MWNLYRSNCKLSKYILTAITAQSLFPLVEHKTEGLDALWRHPGRRQVPIFAPRHEARRAITKMFITYRLSLYDFFFFFSFPALFGTLHNHIKSRADLYSFLGSRSLPGQIEMMARGYCKKGRDWGNLCNQAVSAPIPLAGRTLSLGHFCHYVRYSGRELGWPPRTGALSVNNVYIPVSSPWEDKWWLLKEEVRAVCWHWPQRFSSEPGMSNEPLIGFLSDCRCSTCCRGFMSHAAW